MALARSIQSVVLFLREGYPEGDPVHDHQPLFAVLRRQLSPDEVALVARELVATGDAATTNAATTDAATTVVPTDADIARVQAHLSAGGSPPAPPAQ